MTENEKGQALQTNPQQEAPRIKDERCESNEPKAYLDEGIQKSKSRTDLFNFLLVVFNCLLFLSTSVLAFVAIYQLFAMNKQAGEMEKQVNLMSGQLKVAEGGLAETKRVNTATEQSMKENAEYNKKILEINQKLADYSGKQASAATDAAKASQVSARAAEKSAEVARESLTIGTRPWVLVTAASRKEVKTGDKFSVSITITNAGNTPAFNTKVITGVNSYLRSATPPSFPSAPMLDEISSVTLAPRGTMSQPILHNVALTEELVKEINLERVRYYVWGRIEYDDIFQKHYVTKFCLFNRIDVNEMSYCADHNEAR